MIREVQRSLNVTVDGKAGPQTWSVLYARHVGQQPDAKPFEFIDKVDARSETQIATLLAEAQPFARALVQKAASIGITIKVISAMRTYAEQDALYAKGRTTEGPRVTNVRGGYSNHNFGIAFDVGVFEGTRYLPESSKYDAVGALGKDIGLEWGGNWKSLVDKPHFQLRPAWASEMTQTAMLVELRSRVADGRSVYA